MSHDFHTYGLERIGLNRSAELLEADIQRSKLAATLDSASGRPSMRWRLGGLMIAVGGWIAGTQGTSVASPVPGVMETHGTV